MKNTPFDIRFIVVLAFLFSGTACKNATDATAQDEEVVTTTPVTVAAISHDTITEYVDFPATSTYLLRNILKSNTAGYVHDATTKLGQFVRSGEMLFTIKTKEAENLGNAITVLDSSFKFTGINRIRTNHDGIITQIDHQSGDYVQDGEQLAVITDVGSFAFVMNIPYEQRPLIAGKKTVEVIMPDGQTFNGIIGNEMPLVDSATQTQRVLIRVRSPQQLPENIIARIHILKAAKKNAVAVPKEAVLTDETQSEFWIMKMTDSSTAVKVPIEKGVETASSVEILSPPMKDGDLVVISGNYGLPDTAKVMVTNKTVK